MKLYKQVYIAIDLHSNHSLIGFMNKQGQYIGQQRFPTTAVNLINQVTAIPAESKWLTIEQSNIAFWAAEQLRDHVDKLIVCDPRHNALISASENKNDHLDTLRLCRLLRMGSLKPVWTPEHLGIRRLFYSQMKEYQRLVKTMSIHKRQLTASLRNWGVNTTVSARDYRDPSGIIVQLPSELLREELQAKFSFIESVSGQVRQQFKRIRQTGEPFWKLLSSRRCQEWGQWGRICSPPIFKPHTGFASEGNSFSSVS